jgi:hypothetical protein
MNSHAYDEVIYLYNLQLSHLEMEKKHWLEAAQRTQERIDEIQRTKAEFMVRNIPEKAGLSAE